MPRPRAKCPSCGSAVAKTARFCASCGAALESGDTVRADVPTHQPEPAPARIEQAEPRWFGLPPATLLFALAAVTLVVALVLLVSGNLVAGLLVLGVSLLLAAAFLEAGRRKPDSPMVRLSIDAMDSFRARAGYTARALRTQSEARREIVRRRSELIRLGEEREDLLRALGEAVHRGEDGGDLRARLRELDGRKAALQAEIADVASQAQARVNEARLEVQPTEVRRQDGD